jgi:hyperosmotically inducible periplasmic protein
MKAFLLFSSILLLSAALVAQTAHLAPTALNTDVNQSQAVISSNGPVVLDFSKQQLVTGEPSRAELKVASQVRHAVLTMPINYYGVYDDIEYAVQGRTVTLSGWLTSSHSAARQYVADAVKHIEGVDQVVNNIQILTPRPLDSQARRQVLGALAGTGQLDRYFWPTSPAIHIIVNGLNVTLKGYVNNEADKNLATIATKGIRSVFNVTNDLQVVHG